MKQDDTQKKKTPKGCIWGAVAFVILFAIFMISSKITEENTLAGPGGDWSSWTYEQKHDWMDYYFHHSDQRGDALMSVIYDKIAEQLTYPEEMKLNPYPLLSNAKIIDADRGEGIVEGAGITKNTFGVKVGFVYSVRFICSKDSATIIKVNIDHR